MDILILTNFRADLSITDNNRFVYLSKQLARFHKVELVTSDFWHGRKQHSESLPKEWSFKVTFIHEPGYKKNVCFKRFISHYIWGRNVKRYLKTRKKPDVVYCAVPSLTASSLAAKYCRKNKVRFIIDIQDLWPEAFRMVFHVPLISNLIYKPFECIVNGIYRRADEICGVSQTYVDRALSINRRCKKGYCVFLGTRLETFDENVKNCNLQIEKENLLWLVYCGTLGSSYDLTCVFDALDMVRKRGVKVPKFLIMGTGPKKMEFERYASERQVDAKFTGMIPYDTMCGLLAGCDIAVNPITHGAAQSIINKHADYAAAGLPVLNTQECPEYAQLVNEYKMGFNCENGNASDLADRMIQLISDSKLRKYMGENARKCAEECFDRGNSYKKLMDLITG